MSHTIGGVIVLALLGAAIVFWWLERRSRTRRMMELGFSKDDLRSREKVLKRFGEILLAKVPEKISLKEVNSHPWSNASRYKKERTALEALGFRQGSVFMATPLKWVAEFWLCDKPGLAARIIDSIERGVYCEVSITNRDGSRFSFENTENCGLRHREPEKSVHCGPVPAAALVENAFRVGQPNEIKPFELAEAVREYEGFVNEYLVWRRTVGFDPDEVQNMLNRKARG